jgi:dipeptidyl aminopeptidase/acylaminoacyl peptidase
MRLRLLLFALWMPCLFASEAIAQHGDMPIVATDMFRIQQLGDVRVSPGGRYVLYTVRSVETPSNSEREWSYRTHLWLASATGQPAPRQLTRGDRSASQPVWHPDGERIAFVRTVTGRSQIFVMSLAGGEPVQITNHEFGASAPRWSPDGQRLLFATSLTHAQVTARDGGVPEWPHERPERDHHDWEGYSPDPDGSVGEVRAWLDGGERNRRPRIITRLNFQGEQDLQPEMTFRHLYVVEAREGATPVPVTRGFHSHSGGDWLSNEQIVLAAAYISDEHPDRVRQSSLYVVDPNGSRFRLLVEVDDHALTNPVPSPDGRTVAFSIRALDDPGYTQTMLGIYGIDGRAPVEILTADLDRSVSAATWSPDGWHLYFTAPTGGDFPLYRLPAFGDRPEPIEPAEEDDDIENGAGATALPDIVAGAETETTRTLVRLSGPQTGIRSFDVTARAIYYVLTEVANPFELYANTFLYDQARRMTDHNASWLADRRISVPEEGFVQRITAEEDTLDIHYWIMRPTFAEQGRTYPLLVQIHGGPSAMWGPGEASMWHEFQFFASRGYGIVFSNPRGSGGYGRDFQAANFQDWGYGPAGDVLAAADVAAARSWVDTDRQVITGGSYAGYLTAWIIAHDQRFQAAAAQRGVYDLETFLGEGNAWRLVPNHFGGFPWEDVVITATGDTLTGREVLDANSPMTFVHQIETPLLIKHADEDLRTGVIQSEMLFRSLKILERPVEYARYPGEGHELSRSGDPELRLDRLLRIYEFLARYVE